MADDDRAVVLGPSDSVERAVVCGARWLRRGVAEFMCIRRVDERAPVCPEHGERLTVVTVPERVLAAERRREFRDLLGCSSLGCPLTPRCDHLLGDHEASSYLVDGTPLNPRCTVAGCGCGTRTYPFAPDYTEADLADDVDALGPCPHGNLCAPECTDGCWS